MKVWNDRERKRCELWSEGVGGEEYIEKLWPCEENAEQIMYQSNVVDSWERGSPLHHWKER